MRFSECRTLSRPEQACRVASSVTFFQRTPHTICVCVCLHVCLHLCFAAGPGQILQEPYGDSPLLSCTILVSIEKQHLSTQQVKPYTQQMTQPWTRPKPPQTTSAASPNLSISEKEQPKKWSNRLKHSNTVQKQEPNYIGSRKSQKNTKKPEKQDEFYH